jgi:serine protease Do
MTMRFSHFLMVAALCAPLQALAQDAAPKVGQKPVEAQPAAAEAPLSPGVDAMQPLPAAPAPTPIPEPAVPESRAQISMSFAPLVKQVAPAVVNIYSKRVVTRRMSPFMSDPFFEQFFGDTFGFGGLTRKQVESALGSGVIVDDDGLIVTNAHVVRDSDEITVVLPDGREFEARKTLVDDPSDLALLRVELQSEKLPSVTLHPSETLEVGDLVLAVGNPFGVGQTVTSGIVSAQARSSLNINDFNFFIQTDAAINPGNSGGPLVDMRGGVVGINTAIFSRDGGSLGIGFAVPSEMVASIIAAEKSGADNGHGVVRAWLGVTTQKITSDIADNLGLDMPQGVLIADMHPASPAMEAGLQVGDVVLSMNGKPVREPAEMRFRMATVPLGEEAVFVLQRRGAEKIVKVKAIAPPDKPPRNDTVLAGNTPLSGATIANVNPSVAVELGLSDENGVAIVNVDRRSQAARFVAPGDLVLSVNGRNVTDVNELLKVMETSSGANGWNLLLSREGRKRQIVVR